MPKATVYREVCDRRVTGEVTRPPGILRRGRARDALIATSLVAFHALLAAAALACDVPARCALRLPPGTAVRHM